MAGAQVCDWQGWGALHWTTALCTGSSGRLCGTKPRSNPALPPKARSCNCDGWHQPSTNTSLGTRTPSDMSACCALRPLQVTTAALQALGCRGSQVSSIHRGDPSQLYTATCTQVYIHRVTHTSSMAPSTGHSNRIREQVDEQKGTMSGPACLPLQLYRKDSAPSSGFPHVLVKWKGPGHKDTCRPLLHSKDAHTASRSPAKE